MRSGINFERLQKLTRDAKESYTRIIDENVVLTIGTFGLRDKKGTYLNLLTGKNEIIKSNRNILRPELHSLNDNIMLCECPDFDYFNEGDKEKKISQAISPQLAFNLAKSIKGLLIVFSYSSITQNRGILFGELIKNLSRLFDGNIETIFEHSNFLIVNHPNKSESDYVIFDTIDEIIADLQQALPPDLLDTSKYNDRVLSPDTIDTLNKLSFCKALIKHKEQVFLLDGTENINTRDEIILSLSKLNPIVLENNNFKPKIINFREFYRPISNEIAFNIHKFASHMSKEIKNECRSSPSLNNN